jgi:hypothetical protein
VMARYTDEQIRDKGAAAAAARSGRAPLVASRPGMRPWGLVPAAAPSALSGRTQLPPARVCPPATFAQRRVSSGGEDGPSGAGGMIALKNGMAKPNVPPAYRSAICQTVPADVVKANAIAAMRAAAMTTTAARMVSRYTGPPWGMRVRRSYLASSGQPPREMARFTCSDPSFEAR